MRTLNFELLRPDEIIEEKKRFPVVYFPIGPLEWHSRHMPMGTDPLHAEAVAKGAAAKTGGVVLPTFYWGTEMERSEQMLKNIGFKGDEWIVGMDFPSGSMPSLYVPEDAFSIAVRAYLKLLVTQGYKLIVIVNGHGGENHMRVLENLAREFTATTESTVLCTLITSFGNDESIDDVGHATKEETSIMTYLHPSSVDLSVLPPKGKPLYNTDWAIVDGATFGGNPSKDYTVRERVDPRDASAQQGKESIEAFVRKVADIVLKAAIDILSGKDE